MPVRSHAPTNPHSGQWVWNLHSAAGSRAPRELILEVRWEGHWSNPWEFPGGGATRVFTGKHRFWSQAWVCGWILWPWASRLTRGLSCLTRKWKYGACLPRPLKWNLRGLPGLPRASLERFLISPNHSSFICKVEIITVLTRKNCREKQIR